MRTNNCFVSILLLTSTAFAWGDVEWSIVKPSNTGIPGEEVRLLRYSPEGDLWVAARWPFWGEAGIARWNEAQNTWTVWSNWEAPIPSPYINDVAFAADGVIWLATDGGLVKKDGESWTVYNTANAPLLHNTIMDLDVDSNGVLWLNNSNVQTVNGAIFRFDESSGTWTEFKVGDELPWDLPWGSLSDVIVDDEDRPWVANQVLNGVAMYDGQTWTLYGESVDRFGSLMEDHSGNIWLKAGVGGGNAFWKFDGTTFTGFPIETTPTTMAVDDDGAVYLGDWSGTIRKTVNGGSSWTIFTNIGTHAFNIAPDPLSGDVWVGSQGAARHYNSTGVWQKAFNTYNTGMPWYWIDRFDLDSEGNLWMATGEAGLSRFDGERWRNWGAHNAGSEPYPFEGNEPMGAFYMDSTGTGWMGGNGIARWIPETGEFTGFWNWLNNPGMGVTLFTSFAEDGAGNLFAGTTYGSVFRFDGSLWVAQPTSAGSYTSTYAGVQCDDQGRVWAIGWLKAWLWENQEWTEVGQSWDLFGLGGANSYDIAPDGTLWIGTNEGLLRVVDPPSGPHTLFDIGNSPLPAKQVQGVAIRDDGLIGLSAHTFGSVTPFPSGVSLIDLSGGGDPNDPECWSVFQYGEVPLPHYQLGAVAFDSDGRLWISAISEGPAVLTLPSPADLDGDGLVDLDDYAMLLECLDGPAINAAPECVEADFSGDDFVDLRDMAMLQLEFTGP